MKQSELDEIKASIKGVLNSTQDKLTIYELYNDYKTLNGVEIPFKNLGYHSLIDFLKSIPDTVQLQTPCSLSSFVFVVPDLNTAHINKMVNLQKKSNRPKKCKNHNNKRSNNKLSGKLTNEFRKNVWHIITPFQSGMPLRSFNKEIKTLLCKHNIKQNVEYVLNDISDFTYISGNKIFVNENIKKEDKQEKEVSSYSENSKIFDISEVESESGNFEGSFTNDEIGSITNNLHNENFLEEMNPLISSNLINNLRDLLEDESNKSGIWIRDLPDKYLMKFGYELSPEQHGFTDVTDLVRSLSSVFHVRQYRFGGEELLTDARKNTSEPKNDQEEIPISVISELKKMFCKNRNGIFTDELSEHYLRCYQKTLKPDEFGFKNMDSFLKNIEDFYTDFCFRPVKQKVLMTLNYTPIEKFNDKNITKDDILKDVSFNLFPDEVCGPDFVLPHDPLLNNLQKSQKFFVQVGEVYTPGKFYLHLQENLKKLESMMDDLNSFYRLNEKEYEVLSASVTRGLLCTCQYSGDGKWHRVVIVNTYITNAKTKFIDYGTVEMVAMKKLRYLHKNFANIPALSFRAKLADIKPKQDFDKQNVYSKECNHTFHNYAIFGMLEAEVVNYNFNCMEVYLYHVTEEGEKISIHKKLIENNLVDKKEIMSFAESTFLDLQLKPLNSEINMDLNIPVIKNNNMFNQKKSFGNNINLSKQTMTAEFIPNNISKKNSVTPVSLYQNVPPPGLTLPQFNQINHRFCTPSFASNSNYIGLPFMNQQSIGNTSLNTYLPTYPSFQNYLCEYPNKSYPPPVSINVRPPPSFYNVYSPFSTFATANRIPNSSQLPPPPTRNHRNYNSNKMCQNINYHGTFLHNTRICGCGMCVEAVGVHNVPLITEQVNNKNKLYQTKLETVCDKSAKMNNNENLPNRFINNMKNKVESKNESIRERLGAENDLKKIFDNELGCNSLKTLKDHDKILSEHKNDNFTSKRNFLSMQYAEKLKDELSTNLCNPDEKVTLISHVAPAMDLNISEKNISIITKDVDNNVLKNGKIIPDCNYDSDRIDQNRENNVNENSQYSNEHAIDRTTSKLNPIKQFILQHKKKKVI